MPKHGSIILYVHGNQKARLDGQPRTATSTLTQLLNYDVSFSMFISVSVYLTFLVCRVFFLFYVHVCFSLFHVFSLVGMLHVLCSGLFQSVPRF